MKRKGDLRSFFSPCPGGSGTAAVAGPAVRKRARLPGKLTGIDDPFPCARINIEAERLASKLGAPVTYLSEDGSSWLCLARGWRPPCSGTAFAEHWETHPTKYHELKVFGKVCKENRWSQSWGVSYKYSGSTNSAVPIPSGSLVEDLVSSCNALVEEHQAVYNACLQNWYVPDHTIGLHADDERAHVPGVPIFSLSWGGTRRFLLHPKPGLEGLRPKMEIFLKSGDLLVMGGTCQLTHKHEVPKWRKTKDPPTGNRINWTIRAFDATHARGGAPRGRGGLSAAGGGGGPPRNTKK